VLRLLHTVCVASNQWCSKESISSFACSTKQIVFLKKKKKERKMRCITRCLLYYSTEENRRTCVGCILTKTFSGTLGMDNLVVYLRITMKMMVIMMMVVVVVVIMMMMMMMMMLLMMMMMMMIARTEQCNAHIGQNSATHIIMLVMSVRSFVCVCTPHVAITCL
jgi:hypothetical protein